MSNFNPIRMNAGAKPGGGNMAMQFARKALVDKLSQAPGTPPLGKSAPMVPQLAGSAGTPGLFAAAPHVPPDPKTYGDEGQRGTQPLQTLQNLGKHGSRSR